MQSYKGYQGDKKDFPCNQCKEIEKNNGKGKIRDPFQFAKMNKFNSDDHDLLHLLLWARTP